MSVARNRRKDNDKKNLRALSRAQQQPARGRLILEI